MMTFGKNIFGTGALEYRKSGNSHSIHVLNVCSYKFSWVLRENTLTLIFSVRHTIFVHALLIVSD